ncbi:MAG: 2-amino-4-hydroxy-6-hydroxymethyldihydropteridine diphosphokinase [Deltaproteobacteria bacterium]|nr:2-amino-4-hydroxy-6-hydroxymethyldihydropteridine diphosphokinase [Deltaproteobacteria bacterium]
MAHAFIALGGNLGDVLAAFAVALQSLAGRGGEVVRVSSAYRTAAMLPLGAASAQPDYWNAVCELHTALAPAHLLRLCKEIEEEAGRTSRERWAPRPLDLDLLLYDDRVINEIGLQVPHAGLRARVFVLRPLVEVAPEVRVPPEGIAARELLARLADPKAGIHEVAPLPRSPL